MSKRKKGSAPGKEKGRAKRGSDFGWGTLPAKSLRVPCHEKHPELALGGGTVLGASCNDPRTGYDIYVGLDWGMRRMHPAYPWDPQPESKVVEVYFPITDGQAPKDVVQFTKMVDWLIEQLGQGKRVHIGCIGGHGRTGTLLAALVSRVHGGPGAGEWVRQHYCTSAIETTSQIKFLQVHFNVSPVSPAKTFTYSSGGSVGGQKSLAYRTSYSPIAGRSIWNPAWVSSDLTNENYGIEWDD